MNTFIMSNTYCFSTAAMVTRTRLGVTLYYFALHNCVMCVLLNAVSKDA